jgi:hypothetical protein
MALHAVTVEILIERSKFYEIRAEIRVLDSKLDASVKELKADMQRLNAELNARLAEMEARLVRWVFLVMLGNVALSLATNTMLNALRVCKPRRSNSGDEIRPLASDRVVSQPNPDLLNSRPHATVQRRVQR